ncbi:HCLS1-binding protein 3 [Acropora cervicornis]|uniref:HCLS1-binding protein 3 n=1 Tax=Acropora cervicornis TaxID=6130 RepID=A0AAD9UXL3_ACRCE|nr:HCLS1-binding protein 3 [Acropora cervicornis]
MSSMISLILNNYRELKNRATGIDIFVPQYEHISGSFGGSVLYNVIVVTRLFYFKIPSKHKESDVVQFMLTQKFPSVVFSSPPKKALIISESLISDRRQYMEEVLQQISRTPKLACSSLEEALSEQAEEKSASEEAAEDVDLFANAEELDAGRTKNSEDDEEDLLTEARVSSAVNPSNMTRGFSIFDTNDNKDEDDVRDLFVPADADEKKIDLVEEDNNSELLNIEDDLEKLLTAKSKPSKPLKPAIPAKPNKPVAKPRLKAKPDLKPKPTPKPRFVEGSAGDDELFGTASPSVKPEKPGVTKQKSGSAVQDLFVQGRKPSFNRTASHEEETLDDIFNSASQPSFATTEDDDDLFKQRTGIKESALQVMDADDIASYIQQNLSSTETKLDLF